MKQRHGSKWIWIALLSMWCAGIASAAEPALLLQGARVVDVETERVSNPMDVLLEGDRIVSIAPTSATARKNAQVVDARGRFLLPGFVEMHAHILLHPWLPNGEIARQYDREAALQMLRMLLAYGDHDRTGSGLAHGGSAVSPPADSGRAGHWAGAVHGGAHPEWRAVSVRALHLRRDGGGGSA